MLIVHDIYLFNLFNIYHTLLWNVTDVIVRCHHSVLVITVWYTKNYFEGKYICVCVYIHVYTWDIHDTCIYTCISHIYTHICAYTYIYRYIHIYMRYLLLNEYEWQMGRKYFNFQQRKQIMTNYFLKHYKKFQKNYKSLINVV